MKKIWIIGAGRYGQKAVAAMKQRYPESNITVVDHCSRACEAIAESALTVVCMDGVTYLKQFLTDADAPDWVIPVIPVHLAYAWIQQKLLPEISLLPIELPEFMVRSLPNTYPGKTGEIFVSNASFICPDNCPEPKDICTYTHQPRKRSLFQAIADLPCDVFSNHVLQSHQLAPGIGGIKTAALIQALVAVQQASGLILLSTACRCHGVVNAFRKVIA